MSGQTRVRCRAGCSPATAHQSTAVSSPTAPARPGSESAPTAATSIAAAPAWPHRWIGATRRGDQPARRAPGSAELRAAGAVLGPWRSVRSLHVPGSGISDLLEPVGAAAGWSHYSGDCVVEAGAAGMGRKETHAHCPDQTGVHGRTIVRHADACPGGGTNRPRRGPEPDERQSVCQQEVGLGAHPAPSAVADCGRRPSRAPALKWSATAQRRWSPASGHHRN